MSQPSLVDPDFSGLWSHARIGFPKTWYTKPLGAFWMTFVLCSWVGGFVGPVVALYLLYTGYYTIGVLLLSILVYPYVVEIGANYRVMNQYFWSCYYFDGGSTHAFEENPYDLYQETTQKKFSPQMVCYHPHGIFTIGYMYNGAARITTGLGLQNDDPTLIQRYLGKYGDVVRNEYMKSKKSQEISEESSESKTNECFHNLPTMAIAASLLVYAPLFSWFVGKYSGSLTSASKENVVRLMGQKRSFCLTPGGFHEAALFQKDKEIVYIKNVKGFIKYALQYGYHVIPAYTFGESHTYWNWKGSYSIKKWLCDHQVPAVVVHGPYWWCWILPYSNTGLHTIHGKGKIFPTIENPTSEEINKYHQWYISELKALFDRNKWRFGLDSAELEIM